MTAGTVSCDQGMTFFLRDSGRSDGAGRAGVLSDQAIVHSCPEDRVHVCEQQADVAWRASVLSSPEPSLHCRRPYVAQLELS
jgi:hypothetical protein